MTCGHRPIGTSGVSCFKTAGHDGDHGDRHEAWSPDTKPARPRHVPLGKVQQAVLRCLKEHGQWRGEGMGAGWVWDTLSGTQRVMDSLVRRGLAVVDDEGWYRPAPESKR